jgi:Putative transposase of IS4/5 family (DUF4096)
MCRGDLTNAEWERLKPLLPASSRRGGCWKHHRRLINAVLYRTRTGVPWRDLPECYGCWIPAYQRHRRWSADGTWQRLLTTLQAIDEATRQDVNGSPQNSPNVDRPLGNGPLGNGTDAGGSRGYGQLRNGTDEGGSRGNGELGNGELGYWLLGNGSDADGSRGYGLLGNGSDMEGPLGNGSLDSATVLAPNAVGFPCPAPSVPVGRRGERRRTRRGDRVLASLRARLAAVVQAADT